MRASNETQVAHITGGAGTGRYDRGSTVAEHGAVVLVDPVHKGNIETHDLYGAATPNVGSAWALPRNHPLWAPMDFELRELEKESEAEKEARLAKFEPIERPQLTPEQIAQARKKGLEYFAKKKDDKRVEFIQALIFQGRKPGYYFGRGPKGVGYHLDYVQMRSLMKLEKGQRCEARYNKSKRYFHGIVVKTHDDDCTYDIRFEHGYLATRVRCEHVKPKEWRGKIKETDGVARSLKAANPLMETKDKAVQWYEQLLLYEQGRVDEPAVPEGLFDRKTSEAVIEQEQHDVLVCVEDVVASGDVWKDESSGYKKIWDKEGLPHRSGPPVSADWYGSRDEMDTAMSPGIVKELLEQGDGPRPMAGTVVTCRVLGTRLDGSIFETSHDEKKPWTFKLFCDEDFKGVPKAKRYVQGFHEALASMRKGEVSKFTVAPEKAYGRKGRFPAVPGYSKESPRGTWLIYEIELVDFQSSDDTALVDPSSFGLLERPEGYSWIQKKDDEKRCAYCHKPERTLLRGKKFFKCSKCKTTLYCSAQCAKRDWPCHKTTCSAVEHNQVLAAHAASPTDLVAVLDKQQTRRPRVCLIVAYRNQLPLQDRQGQLFKFVPYFVAFLGGARPHCDFTIVVATQTDDGRKFNRGRLMNAAFNDVVRDGAYDSVVFHDVDILPSEDLMPFYSVPPSPKHPMHLAGAWKTKYDSSDFVGGAIAMTPDDYVACNGYPNDCWGWGLDDEELRLRMREAGLSVVRPPVGRYSDLDPINLQNIVYSDERGYYHEYWNMDMENGKCKPRIRGPIDWALYSKFWRDRGLKDIQGHSELVARTTEFGGRVVRLLYALENDQERKEGTVALMSARLGLQATIEHADKLHGAVADNALAQTYAYDQQGNLKDDRPRLMHANTNLLTPEERFKLRGGRRPRTLAADDTGALVTTREHRRILAPS